MKSLKNLYNRFENLREVQKDEQVELLQINLNEDDIKSIIYWLGLLKLYLYSSDKTKKEDR